MAVYFYKYFLLILLLTYCENRIFHLAVLIPFEGRYPIGNHIAGGLPVALERIALDNVTFSEIHKGGHDIEFTWVDSKCDVREGLSLAADFLYGSAQLGRSVDALIGPACSAVCEPVGILAGYTNTPMISFACVSRHLSDRSAYPTFSRVTGTHSFNLPVWLDLLHVLNYRRVAIVSYPDPICIDIGSALRIFLIQNDIVVTDHMTYAVGENSSNELLRVRQRSRGNSYLSKVLSLRNCSETPFSL